MEDIIYWLALQQKYWLVPARKIAQAIEELGSMEKFWKADTTYLLKLGLKNDAIKKFEGYKSNIDLIFFEKQFNELWGKKVRIICYTDKEYPFTLKEIGLYAPRILFHKGTLLDFKNCVAIGGTRNCSEHGRRAAYDISGKLAENGYTIVSGLAAGIDTEVHKGALDARGKTIAVLAWMNPVYPPENLNLSEEIEQQGAILSECYEKPNANLKWRFVERNKIISGISKWVVVIETSDKGGTVQMVKHALSQKKEVFMLEPDEKNDQALKGYKLLLSKGVTSIKSAEELLELIKGENQSKFKKNRPKSSYQSSIVTFTESSINE
jgi:DNA processing protein